MATVRLLTVKELGALMGVSPVTAWRRIVAGEIEATDIGTKRRPKLRVTETEYEAYIRRRTVSAA